MSHRLFTASDKVSAWLLRRDTRTRVTSVPQHSQVLTSNRSLRVLHDGGSHGVQNASATCAGVWPLCVRLRVRQATVAVNTFKNRENVRQGHTNDKRQHGWRMGGQFGGGFKIFRFGRYSVLRDGTQEHNTQRQLDGASSLVHAHQSWLAPGAKRPAYRNRMEIRRPVPNGLEQYSITLFHSGNLAEISR